jgi:hypothetical protein
MVVSSTIMSWAQAMTTRTHQCARVGGPTWTGVSAAVSTCVIGMPRAGRPVSDGSWWAVLQRGLATSSFEMSGSEPGEQESKGVQIRRLSVDFGRVVGVESPVDESDRRFGGQLERDESGLGS